MSDRFPIIECSIETLDRTLYASRELGDLVDTGDYILSTALYYAFGFVSGKYINQGNKPSYIEDTADIYKKLYITPASLESTEEYLRRIFCIHMRNEGKRSPLPYIGGHSTCYWNARPHQYAVKNWKAADPNNPYKGLNLPKYGRERVLDQQNLFTSYILPYEADATSIIARIPRYVRIGKKKSKAHILTKIIEGRIEDGEFLSNHPFGIYDYEGIPIGDLISVRMRPIPLIIQGRYSGEHIHIPQEGKKEEVVLPYKLELLKGKR